MLIKFAMIGTGPVADVKTSGSTAIAKGKAEFAVDDYDHEGKKD